MPPKNSPGGNNNNNSNMNNNNNNNRQHVTVGGMNSPHMYQDNSNNNSNNNNMQQQQQQQGPYSMNNNNNSNNAPYNNNTNGMMGPQHHHHHHHHSYYSGNNNDPMMDQQQVMQQQQQPPQQGGYNNNNNNNNKGPGMQGSPPHSANNRQGAMQQQQAPAHQHQHQHQQQQQPPMNNYNNNANNSMMNQPPQRPSSLRNTPAPQQQQQQAGYYNSNNNKGGGGSNNYSNPHTPMGMPPQQQQPNFVNNNNNNSNNNMYGGGGPPQPGMMGAEYDTSGGYNNMGAPMQPQQQQPLPPQQQQRGGGGGYNNNNNMNINPNYNNNNYGAGGGQQPMGNNPPMQQQQQQGPNNTHNNRQPYNKNNNNNNMNPNNSGGRGPNMNSNHNSSNGAMMNNNSNMMMDPNMNYANNSIPREGSNINSPAPYYGNNASNNNINGGPPMMSPPPPNGGPMGGPYGGSPMPPMGREGSISGGPAPNMPLPHHNHQMQPLHMQQPMPPHQQQQPPMMMGPQGQRGGQQPPMQQPLPPPPQPPQPGAPYMSAPVMPYGGGPVQQQSYVPYEPMAGGFPDPTEEAEQDLRFSAFLEHEGLIKKSTLAEAFPELFTVPKRGGGQQPPSGRRRVLVDANYMLQSILSPRLEEIDPCWFLHSPLPDQLRELVLENVEQMREASMEPVWVFNGIGISGDVEAFLPDGEELRMREEVWRVLGDATIPDRTRIREAFDVSVSSMGEDVLMSIQRFLRRELGVEAMTAPFLNWCQMIVLLKQGDGDLLYGSPEMALVPYARMRVVTRMDFGTGGAVGVAGCSVEYIDRDMVAAHLFPRLPPEAASSWLIDFGLITASHPALTAARVSLLDNLAPMQRSMLQMLGHLRQLAMNRESLQTLIQIPADFTKHCKGRMYILYSPVFARPTGDNPLRYFRQVCDEAAAIEAGPINLSAVFGFMVPNSLYYFQLTGLLSVRLVSIITQRYFSDRYPVSESYTCRERMSGLIALRTQTVYQIVQLISSPRGSYQDFFSTLSWIRWFRSILMTVSKPGDIIQLDEWDLQPLAGEPEPPVESVGINRVLQLRLRLECLDDVAPGQVLYKGKYQTYLGALLKVFDFLGYFTHAAPDSEQNPEGTEQTSHFVVCLATLLDSLSDLDGDLQDAFVRLTELLRIGVIDHSTWDYVLPPEDAANDMDEVVVPVKDEAEENELPTTLLMSRIACLVHIPYYLPKDDGAEFAWAPVYSRHLSAFAVMVRFMNSDLRELVHVILASFFLNGHSDCSVYDFRELSDKLPFHDVPSIIGALLLHYVLVFPMDYQDNRETPAERIQFLQSRFPGIRNLEASLKTVFTFVFNALYLLNAYRLLEVEAFDLNGLIYTTSVVPDSIVELTEKWRGHFEEEPPADVHNLWNAEEQQ